MSEIDQQFIEYVVKSLVGKPDAVQIDRRVDEKGVLLELTVDPEDLGRVIGKRGATAQSLRTLLRALGTKNDARYNLKIIDNGDPEHSHSHGSDDHKADDTDDHKKPAKKEKAEAHDDAATPTAEEPAAEPEEPKAEAPAEEVQRDETSDRLAAAREELADLDDLDI